MCVELINKSDTRTSRGVLSKAWYNVDGEVVIVKGCTENGYEVYSEVMASRIAKLLGFNSVSYWLDDSEKFPEIDNKGVSHVSICKTFLSENEEYVSIYNRLGFSKDSKWTGKQWWEESIKLLGKKFLDEILILDAIIGNEDRHLNNFGFIFNSEKEEYIPAPIFDSGASLLAWVRGDDLEFKARKYIYDKARPFKSKHKKQIKLVSDSININDISFLKLKNSIIDILDLLPNSRKTAILTYLEWRCKEYVNIC